MIPKQPLFSSQHTSIVDPKPSLLIIKLLCGLHLFTAAIITPTKTNTSSTTSFSFSNLLTSTAPLQLPFLLFLSGFVCTYASAHNHKNAKFSSSHFYVRRFATILPAYIFVLILHSLLLSTDPNPLFRFIGAATGLSPYLPQSFAFSPKDAPFLAQNLIPSLMICYLIFPVILDMLPRYDTTKRIHFMYVAVSLYAVTFLQAFWLANLPADSEKGRSIVLFDLTAYVPFLAHIPTFVFGMVTALLLLSHRHHYATAPLTSLSLRIGRLVLTIVIFISLILLIFPTSSTSTQTIRSTWNNWLICGAFLPFFTAIVLASVSLSKPRISQSINHTGNQIDQQFTQQNSISSPKVLDHLSLENISHISYLTYVLFPTLPRILSVALCHAPATTSSDSSQASSTISLLCSSTPPLPRVTGPLGIQVEFDSITEAAANRALSATYLSEPQIQPALFVLVLVFVVSGYYAIGFARFADLAERSYSDFVDRIHNGFYSNSRFNSLTKWLFLESESQMPRRNNSTFERIVRVIVYFIAAAIFWTVVFRYSIPLTFYGERKKSSSFLCWLPDIVYDCNNILTASEIIAERSHGNVNNLEKSGWILTVLKSFVEICKNFSLLSCASIMLNIFGHVRFPRAIWKRLPTIPQMLSTTSSDNINQIEQGENHIPENTDPKSEYGATNQQMHGVVPSIQQNNGVEGKTIKSWFSSYQVIPKPLSLDFVLYIRYVTRGNSPNLVISNVERAVDILTKTGIPQYMWKVEVVTDTPLNLHKYVPGPAVCEIVVPSSYQTAKGTLYKARALNYAILHSSAESKDWIVHLDEETRFDTDSIRAVFYHCSRESYLTFVEKSQEWPRIGQGAILFGQAMMDESIAGKDVGSGNWITTLADSVRVSDDCGRYRIQFECGEVWTGMHGSFAVISNKVEQEITFDYGVEGSIAEDAFFAMLARSRGVHFAWIDGLMYEQSPFTVIDFIKQRSRWLVGGLRVVLSQRVPLQQRSGMSVFTLLWSLMPFTYISLIIALLFGDSYDGKSNTYYYVVLPILACASLWNYSFGFFVTFRVRKLGIIRFFVLYYLQLVLTPLFGVMEVSSVAYAIWNYAKVSVGFHVIEKDTQVEKKLQTKLAKDDNEVEATTEQDLIDLNSKRQQSSLEDATEETPLM